MAWSRRNFAPVLFLSIDGEDATDLLRTTISFAHKSSQNKAAETKFVMRNDDRILLDDPRTFPNKIWKFRFGYFNDLSPIHVAQIREVAPSYADKRIVTFTLYDLSMNISQGSGAKSWGTVPSSQIAIQIAKNNGFTAVVDPSDDKPKKAFIQPASVNDLQFLRDLAAEIDYEVFVDGSPPKLYYRKKPYDEQPHRRLTYYDDPSEYSYVKSFTPKVKSLGPLNSGVSKANSGKGKDGKDAKSAEGQDASLGPYRSLDGDTGNSQHVAGKTPMDISDVSLALAAASGAGVAGPAVAGAIIASKPASRSRDAVSKIAPSGANPTALAASARSQLLDKANEATSDHPLTPSIVCGRVYEWTGIEKQVNGKWYADEVEHAMDGTNSTTKSKWKRNAKGVGNDKAKNTNNKDPEESDKSFLGWGPGGKGDFVDHTGTQGQKNLEVNGDTGEQQYKNYLTTAK